MGRLRGWFRSDCLAAGAAATGFLYALAAATLWAADRKNSAPQENASAPADPAIYGIELAADDRAHWSFQPIQATQPPLPARGSDWIKSPIDAWVLQKLRDQGLEPSPQTDDRTWLRRVSFDLIGLPPSPEQMDEFLSDASTDKRERAVERLLADPGYGVRWGRHWLDVVRYADTNGYERDGDKPQAWLYRDWVIESLNADKPFDRFMTEQIAGDDLDDATAETMIATTFLRLGTWDDEPADPMVDRYDQLDDVVGTVSTTFLGLTLRCARCHNHKFEPLSQIDYARMLAVFEPLKRPQKDRTELVVPVGTRAELDHFRAASSRTGTAIDALQAQVKSLDERVRERYFAAGVTQLAAEAFAAHRTADQQRNDSQKKLVKETRKQFEAEVAAARSPQEQNERAAFHAGIDAIRAALPSLPQGYLWEEPAGAPPPTHVFRRGNPSTPAGIVAPGIPAVLATARTPEFAAAQSTTRSRRRLSFARWLTAPDNPLTARVMVNRIWQGHFGEGLVRSENDFGVMGDTPSHPVLLDWLASWFRDNRWSLKSLHKLIILSSTYGQTSTWRADAARVDVDNRLLWRFPYRRLNAEAVRDAVLFVNGRLNMKHGGPGIYPNIAREVLEGQSRPGEGWGKSDEWEAARRSIYIHVKRALIVPELEILDFADTTTSCEQRPVSTIPTQALTFLNGEFLNEQAKQFAARVIREAGLDQTAQIEQAYRLLLGRRPDVREGVAALAFLHNQETRLFDEGLLKGENPTRRGREMALQALCVVLYNLNEFSYVD